MIEHTEPLQPVESDPKLQALEAELADSLQAAREQLVEPVNPVFAANLLVRLQNQHLQEANSSTAPRLLPAPVTIWDRIWTFYKLNGALALGVTALFLVGTVSVGAYVAVPGVQASIRNLLEQPTTYEIEVISQPAGAEVYLGDKLIGFTPFSYGLSAGSHELRFKLDGYQDVVEGIEVTANGSKRLQVLLPPVVETAEVNYRELLQPKLGFKQLVPDSWQVRLHDEDGVFADFSEPLWRVNATDSEGDMGIWSQIEFNIITALERQAEGELVVELPVNIGQLELRYSGKPITAEPPFISGEMPLEERLAVYSQYFSDLRNQAFAERDQGNWYVYWTLPLNDGRMAVLTARSLPSSEIVDLNLVDSWNLQMAALVTGVYQWQYDAEQDQGRRSTPTPSPVSVPVTERAR